MEIGVQTKGLIPNKTPEKAMKMIAEAGFTRVDFNLDSYLLNSDVYAGKMNHFFDQEVEDLLAYFAPYKEAMEKNNIRPSQMHAPYPYLIPGAGEQNEYMSGVVIPKSIVIAEFLQVPWVIVHPAKLQYIDGLEEEKKQNISYFKMLIPLLKQCHVKICFENLYEGIGQRIVEGVCADPNEAMYYVDTMNELAGEELFGFCLDTGHLQLARRDPYDFITKMGKRIQCLHLHENDGWEDMHQLPYTFGHGSRDGQNWNRLLQGLTEVGFHGTLSFETYPSMNSFPMPMQQTLLQTIHAIGEHFSQQMGENR